MPSNRSSVKDVKTPRTFASCQAPSARLSWTELARIFANPGELAACDDAAFEKAVASLTSEGVFPVFMRALHEYVDRVALTQSRQARLEEMLTAHKASSAVLWSEFDDVIGRLTAEGFAPIPIKGTHVGWAYYSRPHLRPMSDIDLFFTDLTEAEKACQILMTAGYSPCETVRGGSPWLWNRHLPELASPRTKIRIELHGGLIYAPRDSRSHRERVLVEDLRPLAYGGHTLRTLSPEAAMVYLLAHEFERHAADEPKMQALFDVAAIVQSCKDNLDWERLHDLAIRSGFAGPVLAGLRAARQFAHAKVPEELLTRLSARDREAAKVLKEGANHRQATLSRQAVEAIVHTNGFATLVQKLFYMIFPSAGFMRFRYADKANVPVLALYPYRWAVQLRKLYSLVFFGRRPRP